MTGKKKDEARTAAPDPVLTEGIAAALRPPPAPIIDVPDIVTFAEHPSFVGDGGSPGLFPVQRTLLRLSNLETEHFTSYDEDKIGRWADGYYSGPYRWGVQPDIQRRIEILVERGRKHFATVLFVGGRRAGKNHLGALIAAHQLYGLIAMDDPQARYGIAPGKHLRTIVTATTYPQARDNQFNDLFQMLSLGHCFRPHLAVSRRNHVALWAPADRRRFAELGRRDRRLELEQASIRASAIAPNASGARGSACTCLIFDEFAHSLEGTESVRTGEQVYRALIPSLGQVHPDGITYIPTSPWTMETHCFRLYEMSLEVDADGEPRYPEILLIHLPSWGPYEDAFNPVATEGRTFVTVPMASDDRVAQARDSDEASYQVEYLAQWREVEQGFLDPAAVEDVFAPFCEGCAQPMPEDATCPRCGGVPRLLVETDRGVLAFVYRGHADPSAKKAYTAVVIAHGEEFTLPEGDAWSHVIVDVIRVYRPEDYPGHAIPYDRIEDNIVRTITRFRTLEVFSFDQFASLSTVPRLRDRLRIAGHDALVREVTFTEGSNRQRAYIFKAAIARGWIHSFRDTFGSQGRSLLEQELKALRLKGDKVVAPTGGPVRTKDAADCLMVVTEELLRDQLQRGPRRTNLTQPLQAVGKGSLRDGTVFGGLRQKSKARATLESYKLLRPPHGGLRYRNPIGPQGLDWHKRGPAG